MHTLTLHLEYLLLHHDCVVLPGMGAFINVRNSACFDEEKGEWLPMHREVRFNASLIHDDGLLATSFGRREGKGFTVGREAMYKEIDRLKDIVRSEGEATLGTLGILGERDGALVFLPSPLGRNASAALGYTAAPVGFRKREDGVGEGHKEHSPEESVGAPCGVCNAADAQSETRFDTRKNYYIAVNKRFAHVAACLAALVIVSVLLLFPIAGPPGEQRASLFPVTQIAPRTVVADTVIPAAAPMVQVAEASPSGQDSNAVKHRFHAVVGTFKTKGEAERFISMQSGEYPLQVLPSKTLVRVGAASADEESGVREAMRKPGFRETYPEAWIWEERR